LAESSAVSQRTLHLDHRLLVRAGNPKKIKDWNDLAPSGCFGHHGQSQDFRRARWNFLAAWGYALKKYGSEEQGSRICDQAV